MLRWFRRRLKPITRGLLATLVSLWLVADATPCAMAQSYQLGRPCMHCPMPPDIAPTGMHNDRAPVMSINCKLPDINLPLSAALGDFAVTPVLLTTLPVSLILPQTRQHPQSDFFTPDFPAPPLHIQHVTLIL
jgi:hypothetical protein